MSDQVFQPPPGWPTEPEYVPEPRGYAQGGYVPDTVRSHGPAVPPDQRYLRIDHYYAAPQQPARRGPDPWQVLGWILAGGALTGVLLAVALAAIAIAVAGVALALTVCVLYLLLRSSK
jgi:hypothetical protein